MGAPSSARARRERKRPRKYGEDDEDTDTDGGEAPEEGEGTTEAEALLLARHVGLLAQARLLNALLGNAADGAEEKQTMTQKERDAQASEKLKQQLIEQLRRQKEQQEGRVDGGADATVSGRPTTGPRAHLEAEGAGPAAAAAPPAPKRKRPGARRMVRGPKKPAAAANAPMGPMEAPAVVVGGIPPSWYAPRRARCVTERPADRPGGGGRVPASSG